MNEIEELIIQKMTSDPQWDDLRAQLLGPSTRRTKMSNERTLREALGKEDLMIDEMVELGEELLADANNLISGLSGLKNNQTKQAVLWLRGFQRWNHLKKELERSEEENPLPTIRALEASSPQAIPVMGTIDGKGIYDKDGNNVVLAKYPHSSTEEEE